MKRHERWFFSLLVSVLVLLSSSVAVSEVWSSALTLPSGEVSMQTHAASGESGLYRIPVRNETGMVFFCIEAAENHPRCQLAIFDEQEQLLAASSCPAGEALRLSIRLEGNRSYYARVICETAGYTAGYRFGWCDGVHQGDSEACCAVCEEPSEPALYRPGILHTDRFTLRKN